LIAQRPIEFPFAGLSDGLILLRLQTDADLPAVIRACQDPEISRWTRVPSQYGEAEAREWHEHQARARDAGAMLHLLVVDASTDHLLGSAGIVRVDWEEGRCELGYWLARESRGRGIARRAVALLCRWIFESLPIERIEIHAEPANTPSRRVAEAAGFRFEGVLRSYFVNKGERRDAASYSLLRGELPS
jgi:[ribosomal protein S5]-alanine N-acetyltransferase